ncbi:hypothetical protein [Alteribacter aurantiacus]|uniref:hypothetical protein n=1 Tax=Alteribacter aurantiacus TaxID=254410 RepID=UPI0004052695|nr:hypothetical protein [Alteribacter aurantiacus]
MRKTTVLLLFILILSACGGKVDEVTLYEMNSFSEINDDFTVVITDEEDIEIFKKAVNGAKKQSGNVDMVDPDYKMEMGDDSYFLWTSPENGTVSNTKDTHTIYQLTSDSASQVNEWLSKHEID